MPATPAHFFYCSLLIYCILQLFCCVIVIWHYQMSGIICPISESDGFVIKGLKKIAGKKV